MSDKIDNSVFKKGSKTIDNATLQLVDKKVDFFKDVIQKTILHVQKQKTLDILGVSDVSICIDKLIDLNKKINDKFKDHSNANTDIVINNLQSVNNDFSSLIKNYGTDNLEDLLIICFGNTVKITTNETETLKFDILKKYFHPTGYKIVTKSKKTSEDYVDESTKHLDCFDITSVFKQFHMRVYGMKLYIHSALLKKHLVVYGIVDDVIVEYLNTKYVTAKREDIKKNLPTDVDYHSDAFDMFVSSLTLKDYLLYDNSSDFYNKYAGYVSQNNDDEAGTDK
jgi:hypothetical protein